MDPPEGRFAGLPIRHRLDELLGAGGALAPLDPRTVYVVFLAKGLEARLGDASSERDFWAYHSYFGMNEGRHRPLRRRALRRSIRALGRTRPGEPAPGSAQPRGQRHLLIGPGAGGGRERPSPARLLDGARLASLAEGHVPAEASAERRGVGEGLRGVRRTGSSPVPSRHRRRSTAPRSRWRRPASTSAGPRERRRASPRPPRPRRLARPRRTGSSAGSGCRAVPRAGRPPRRR